MMDKAGKTFPVADVSPQQVEDIRRLEEQLTEQKGKNVVLVAYEEKSQS